MDKKKQTHILYGFLTSLALIILFVAIEVAGLSDMKGIQFIGWVVMLAGLIWNAIAFSKANNAEVSFGQVFGSCFKAAAIITIVVVIWSMVMFQIFPGMETKMLDKAREGMSAQKGMTDEQIEKGMAMTQKYFKVFIAAGALFGTLIEGLIFSLIAAAIAKKKPKATQVSI